MNFIAGEIGQAKSRFSSVPRDVDRSEKFAIVAKLFTHGADVNVMGGKRQTPLHYAAACSDDCTVIVQMLLDKRAHTDVQNEEGITPLDIARNDNEPVVNLLLTMAPARLGIARYNCSSSSASGCFGIACMSSVVDPNSIVEGYSMELVLTGLRGREA